MHAWTEWDHIVKVDPDKTLYEDETFEDVAKTGTDAIMVGGTLGITEEKMAEYVRGCIEGTQAADVPVFIEPSSAGVVVHPDGLGGYLVPIVFNAGDIAWMTGAHKEWVRMDPNIDWDCTHTEAYIVLNEDASVAEYTQADCDLGPDDVAAYAEVAEQMFGQDIVYVEYSGTLGDPDLVAAAHDALDDATLFYGGGVHGYDSAHQMGQHSDVVVVGDLVHDEGCAAVRDTVEGVRAVDN
ncbi:phosphoglycerol geranylgeranyltransferase [Halomarina salina]|uniref:Phosphoglycerol geranylgeranyltransferase n=1 Tax=Halomarina salina TaxID=1872699 RepID=A0ABD5RJH0_9EURY|nr:putative phosphoglycerol geranylgeranyltransferase [Halomarina salina]